MRRRSSTYHWYTSGSGSSTSTRATRPVARRRARIRPASIVLPRPTSSASSTRGGRRAAQQRVQAQLEMIGAIDAAGDQARIGLAHVLHVVEFAFVQAAAFADVAQHVALVLDPFDHERLAGAADAFAGPEFGACEGRHLR